MPGELYCGGALVARGYLDNPELTEARFPPDPYGGGAMYRTGDVVKWGLDGSMVYLGRNDTQVQLRGYRVELAEVEGALLTHPRCGRAPWPPRTTNSSRSWSTGPARTPSTTCGRTCARHCRRTWCRRGS
ncbi:hypothetical protein NKG94_50170 [Micromonospora sp. M12]